MSGSRRQLRSGLAVMVVSTCLVMAFAGQAQTPEPDIELDANIASAERALIERLVDDWYVQQCAAENGRADLLMAPGAINASPGYRQ